MKLSHSKTPWMRPKSWQLGLTAAAAFVACQPANESDEFRDAAPELGALQMELTGNVEAESLAGPSDMIDAASETADALEAMGGAGSESFSEGLADTEAALHDFNDSLRHFLEPVAALLREEPTKTVGRAFIWGPVVRGATEYRVTLRRGGVHRFGWLVEARLADSGEGFTAVAAGGILVDRTPRRGVGTAGFNLDKLREVDPTVVAQGQLLVGFAHGEPGTSLSFALHDFTPDPEKHAPVDALWKGVHFAKGPSVVRLAYHGNVSSTATAAEELVLARARHLRGQGGRIDAIVTGGDVASGTALVKSECYDRGGKLTYAIVRQCGDSTLDEGSCEVLSREGKLSSCLPDFLEELLPPLDPNSKDEHDEDPNGQVEPPASMPDGNAP